MLYPLSLIVLAPILIAQGKYVRRVTPLLPEPVGPRFGHSGQGELVRLLVIGDSAAAGVGVEQQDQALCGQLVSTLAKTHEVEWLLEAKTANTSAQVLSTLKSLPRKPWDVAVVSVGVNDVTSMTRSDVWEQNLTELVSILCHEFCCRHVYLSSVPPMHLFPALPNPLRWWLGLRAKQFNIIMDRVAQSDTRCKFVQVPYRGDEEEIAADGFHPGALAYQAWSEHLAEKIRRLDVASQ
ncbi:SGNH/GDSL hydrolase family protein [Reinekea blandensis]|uniref:SGNH hydrolase-type esterase domain-containing protein n=1 Tax=Reinekea blandensis MED297 TaxID=314283 RepID=A4BHN8_9GAMM|nr:SGNH/GDSL hydrolase family protein [Reinekea blandensis]EAR08293.1 hypothetical protein MED297_09141 [Reinekea sp. MED297] [Reinekea blandensis MED297]